MPDTPAPETPPARAPGPADVRPSPDDAEEDAFRALVAGASRDEAVRSCFAAVLAAQGLPVEESDSIWRSFLAAADGPDERKSSLVP